MNDSGSRLGHRLLALLMLENGAALAAAGLKSTERPWKRVAVRASRQLDRGQRRTGPAYTGGSRSLVPARIHRRMRAQWPALSGLDATRAAGRSQDHLVIL